jgi:hypothetical protein
MVYIHVRNIGFLRLSCDVAMQDGSTVYSTMQLIAALYTGLRHTPPPANTTTRRRKRASPLLLFIVILAFFVRSRLSLSSSALQDIAVIHTVHVHASRRFTSRSTPQRRFFFPVVYPVESRTRTHQM